MNLHELASTIDAEILPEEGFCKIVYSDGTILVFKGKNRFYNSHNGLRLILEQSGARLPSKPIPASLPESTKIPNNEHVALLVEVYTKHNAKLSRIKAFDLCKVPNRVSKEVIKQLPLILTTNKPTQELLDDINELESPINVKQYRLTLVEVIEAMGIFGLDHMIEVSLNPKSQKQVDSLHKKAKIILRNHEKGIV